MLIMCSMNAFAATTYKDGSYNVNTTLTGSSHGSAIEATTLNVNGGAMTARITFSSKKLTWLMLNGKKYNNEGTTGTTNSIFTIPVEVLDTNFTVTVETVAMSKPYTVEYTLNISSAGVPTADVPAKQESNSDNANNNTTTGGQETQGQPVVIAPTNDSTPASSQEASTTVASSTEASTTVASSTEASKAAASTASSTESSKESKAEDNQGNGTLIAVIVVVVVVVVGAAVIAVLAKKKIKK